LFPRIRTTFSATSCLLLSTEGASNLGTGGSDIHVHDTAVGTTGSGPLEDVLHILGEDGTGESLGHSVIDFDGLIEGVEFDDVEDGSKELFVQDLSVLVDGDDGGFNEESLSVLQGLTTMEDLTSLFLDFLDTFLVILDGGLGVEGTAEGTFLEGISNYDRFVG